MIYGASGYTGNLITARAVASGLQPILAGRNARKLSLMARTFGLETRVFGLGDPGRLAKALDDVAVVLHCAGPFVHTATPMVDACLRAGTHYLDITGEMDVFESLAARDQDANVSRIMILPGAGIDVVPSDCLIAGLAARHPGGQYLRLGLATRSGVSRGTMRTILTSIENFRIRREGKITRVAAGSLRHEFDFGDPPRSALVSSLGDVSTAYWSTGIPNIESYNQASNLFRIMTGISRLYGRLPAKRIWLSLLNALVDRVPAGAKRIAASSQLRDLRRRDSGFDRQARGGTSPHSRPLRPDRRRSRKHRHPHPKGRFQDRIPDAIFSIRRRSDSRVRWRTLGNTWTVRFPIPRAQPTQVRPVIGRGGRPNLPHQLRSSQFFFRSSAGQQSRHY